MNYTEAKALVERYGQEHLLRFWDELNESEREGLLSQIAAVDWSLLSLIHDQSAITAERGHLEPLGALEIPEIEARRAEFEACGINQTRHKVYLKVTASIRIVIPTGVKTTQVSANMLVAESIIVGGVPEGFVGYNTYRNSKGPDYYGKSLSEFIKNRKYYGTVLMAINNKK